MVRFVNSGTETCMAVLRLMRAYTGRDKVIKFDGCYHGHADMFLVKAGSGVAASDCQILGVPRTTTANTRHLTTILKQSKNYFQKILTLFQVYS